MAAYYYSEVMRLTVQQAAIRVLPATLPGIILSVIIAMVITWFSDGVLLLITNCLNAWVPLGYRFPMFSELTARRGPMLFAIRMVAAPYWQYELWAWLFMGHATEGMQAVGQILISHTTFPDDQAAAMGKLHASASAGRWRLTRQPYCWLFSDSELLLAWQSRPPSAPQSPRNTLATRSEPTRTTFWPTRWASGRPSGSAQRHSSVVRPASNHFIIDPGGLCEDE